jgi:hypothetical protein
MHDNPISSHPRKKGGIVGCDRASTVSHTVSLKHSSLHTVMSVNKTAEIALHSLASLENRRAAPGKPNTFIYDAVFKCLDAFEDGIGSFRHYVGLDKSKKQDNVYEIRAKVGVARRSPLKTPDTSHTLMITDCCV